MRFPHVFCVYSPRNDCSRHNDATSAPHTVLCAHPRRLLRRCATEGVECGSTECLATKVHITEAFVVWPVHVFVALVNVAMYH